MSSPPADACKARGDGSACVKCDGSTRGCLAGGDTFCVGLDIECT